MTFFVLKGKNRVTKFISAEQKNLVRFYRTIMKSYGSTFVTFPSHLPQREETCQKSLHHQKTQHTYLQMYYSSNMLSVAKKCTDIHVKLQ